MLGPKDYWTIILCYSPGHCEVCDDWQCCSPLSLFLLTVVRQWVITLEKELPEQLALPRGWENTWR